MGKFKKMLAGMLSAAMVVSTMTVSAFAAQRTPSTIDTTKKGSITIHKYEYNGTAGKIGTGSERDQVPEGAKALEGAGFTIYKVADAKDKDLEKYYSTNPTELPSVEEYTENGKIKAAYEGKKVENEIKTGTDGIAAFNELDLGFYVVVETTTPDKVTTPVAPFLVSVPMTTTDGDNWLYDVHVYPKNKTTYGGVTLEKQGNTKKDKLAGVTFVLQKKTGDTWTDVTTNESDGTALNLVTNENGQIIVDGLSQGTYRFIETNRGNNDGYIMDGATTYKFVVGADGKITYNDKTENNITITVKNEKPDLTKEVKNRTDLTWRRDSNYNVGDMVPYKITVKVPSNITKLKYFTVTDTPTNLKDDVNTVEVKDGDTAVAKVPYTVAGAGNGFTVTFDPAKMGEYAGKELVITYSAELLSTAKTTTEGNPNTAKLEYSNKILPDTDDGSNPNNPGEPGKDAIEDNAIVYTFKLNIIKKANSANGDALADVQFDLYKEVPAGTKGAISADDAKAAGLDTSRAWIKVAADLTTDAKGKVSCSGLANGTYYLVETKTVEGYNLLKAPVEVTLEVAYTTTTRDEYYIDKNSVKTLVKHEVTTKEFKEDSKTSDGTHPETIINKKGFQLPTTGGMGTILFSVAGVLVMIAAAFILLKGRKKEA